MIWCLVFLLQGNSLPHYLCVTDSPRPPCVLDRSPGTESSVRSPASRPILPFSTWMISRRARSDYNNNNIPCHLPDAACVNLISLAHPRCLLFPEPNAYRSMVGRAVNSTQLAQDYTKLRTLLQSVRYYHRAHLYGPNAGRPRKNAIVLLDGWVGK